MPKRCFTAPPRRWHWKFVQRRSKVSMTSPGESEKCRPVAALMGPLRAGPEYTYMPVTAFFGDLIGLARGLFPGHDRRICICASPTLQACPKRGFKLAASMAQGAGKARDGRGGEEPSQPSRMHLYVSDIPDTPTSKGGLVWGRFRNEFGRNLM